MDSRFPLKLLVHGMGLLSQKLRPWLYLDQILFKISVHPFRIITLEGSCGILNQKLSGTHTKSKTVIRLRGCSIELQGSQRRHEARLIMFYKIING